MSSQKRPYELKARAKRQAETRQRIVKAAVGLHEEVGPARTTVAEIARRAGVQRLTVYNHFPEDGDLFAACRSHFLARHPIPDLGPAFALDDPRDRVRAGLAAVYESYRAAERMTGKLLRDRSALPALDALMEMTMDQPLAQLAELLAAGFKAHRATRHRLHVVLGLALDFWTWQRLTSEGLDDAEAADLMADLVAAAADATGSNK
jgi:AcrR family transcriptional regulator